MQAATPPRWDSNSSTHKTTHAIDDDDDQLFSLNCTNAVRWYTNYNSNTPRAAAKYASYTRTNTPALYYTTLYIQRTLTH